MSRYYQKSEAISVMNTLGSQREPFFFVIDFEMEKIVIKKISELNGDLKFDIGKYHYSPAIETSTEINVSFEPYAKEKYREKFEKAKAQLAYGNSFLLNLTCPTVLKTTNRLEDFYNNTEAKYKVYLRNEFVCFSPECFIKIHSGKIFSYPMKGTSRLLEDPEGKQLLKNRKENAEHATIVDLLRNDLSMIAKNVDVDRFKYIDVIRTDRGDLNQMSSEVSGDLPKNYHELLGNIIFTLLPAGSICGAPKIKTVEIIKELEEEDRSYYTGIAGVFDGHQLDSGVLIRLIEQKSDQLRYRSGGGITFMSELDSEYKELIDKIYVPVNRDYQDKKWSSIQYSLSQ